MTVAQFPAFFLPIAFPQKAISPPNTIVLAADVGGTKTNLALYRFRDGHISLLKEHKYASREWESLIEIIRHFTGDAPEAPQRLSIAFAGPIQNGKAKATNLDWEVDIQELAQKLEISDVFLINDLEAGAYGLAALSGDEIRELYPGKGKLGAGNAALIAPGTGLGEAGLFWDGAALHPFATEGGHTDFAPRNELDWELLRFAMKLFGHVSWERIVSGPGIHLIFQFLHEVKKEPAPDWLLQQMDDDDPAAVISAAARENCAICVETLNLFVRYLAEEAANLALKLKATGGLLIGGGIPPKIWNDQLEEVFLGNVFEVGRLRPLLEATPIYLIQNTKTALLGAAYYGAFSKSEAHLR